jgi:hypothetical protein
MIKMLTLWSHLDIKYPAEVSFLWPSPEFFEILSGEESADSYSKEQEIDYLMICVSCGLRRDKDQWLVAEIVKCEPGYGLE